MRNPPKGRGDAGALRTTARTAWRPLGALLILGLSSALAVGSPMPIVATADGGSTIPIPPPAAPTPQTVTPGAIPTRTAVPTQEPTALDLTNLQLGPGAAAISLQGTDVPLTGDPIRVETDAQGKQRVMLPLDPSVLRYPMSLVDPGSGVSWRYLGPGATARLPLGGGILTIPLVGARVRGTLSVETGPLVRDGQDTDTYATVVGVVLEANTKEMEGTNIGELGVRLSMGLEKIPDSLAMDIRDVAPNPRVVASISRAAEVSELGVASVAYAVEVDLQLEAGITSPTIELVAAEQWADTWPSDRIGIARVSAEGVGSLLETTLLDGESGTGVRFMAASPEGYSTFALVALGALTTGVEESPGPTWSTWPGVGLALVALAGLGAGTYLIMAQRRQRANPQPPSEGP